MEVLHFLLQLCMYVYDAARLACACKHSRAPNSRMVTKLHYHVVAMLTNNCPHGAHHDISCAGSVHAMVGVIHQQTFMR